jgi:hypothetical protein
LSALTEIQGLDGDDRKKVFALAQEGLRNWLALNDFFIFIQII